MPHKPDCDDSGLAPQEWHFRAQMHFLKVLSLPRLGTQLTKRGDSDIVRKGDVAESMPIVSSGNEGLWSARS